MKVYLGRYPEDNKERKVSIRIDKWDSWNADHTLAMIALPVIKQLKETKQSFGLVDLNDVPESMRLNYDEYSSNFELFPELRQDTLDKNWNLTQDRYEYVLDEIIFALDFIANDKEQQFFVHPQEVYDAEEDIMKQIQRIKVDWEGLKAARERTQKGLELFGKYFQSLWD